MPKVSFIVSYYDRPDHLACLLYSLKLQTFRDFEVIVTDSGGFIPNLETIVDVKDDRFRYIHTPTMDCYESANLAGGTLAQGEYLCFPSDDDYYGPRFLELMLLHGGDADLIYCNYVDDSCGNECAVMNCLPAIGHIDKGGFLVRRALFQGFGRPYSVSADGQFIEGLVRGGIRHRKVEIVGWVHN